MNNPKPNRLFRILRYRAYRLGRWFSGLPRRRNYEIIVSVIIGAVAGLVAVLLKYLVSLFRIWIHGQDPTSERLGFVFFPLIGILLTVAYVKLVLRRPLAPGLSELIYAITRKKVNLPAYESYAHVVSSSLTVGFGGSVGLEAPIIRTGSAIGSNLARLLRVGPRRQTLFLACGASAGMAAIFNSPVAGLIFSFEVLLSEMALQSFIPLLISSATGAVIARMLFYERLFFLPVEDWALNSLPFYIMLGVLCGLLSVYMIRTTLRIGDYFDRIKRPVSKFLIGGLAMGILVFFMPPLFGEGYDMVRDLFAGRFTALVDHSIFYRFADLPFFLLAFATFIILAKAVAAAVTIALGGNGGVFAPSMFVGALLGYVFADLWNQLGWIPLDRASFAAVAMAGLLSGVFKSPLTGIFLIAEITGGYSLFIPLMIVSALAYFVTYYFEPYSIFTRELYHRGLWVPAHERDRHILQNMNVRSLVETNFFPIRPEWTLGEFVKAIARSNRNVFPVVDTEGKFRGIVLLDDVRQIMFDVSQYGQIRVLDLMHNPPAIVEVDEPMEMVMNKFDEHNAWNLPVVDKGFYQGFVSKSSVFNRYRELLIIRSREI